MQAFCERFKDLRKEHKLSTLEMGKALKVDHSTILRWEKGERVPNIDHLYNIAKYFGVTADYLIGLSDY